MSKIRRKKFVNLFNGCENCVDAKKDFRKSTLIEREKKEFYKLRIKFLKKEMFKNGRKEYDRMRILGKKYNLFYKKPTCK